MGKSISSPPLCPPAPHATEAITGPPYPFTALSLLKPSPLPEILFLSYFCLSRLIANVYSSKKFLHIKQKKSGLLPFFPPSLGSCSTLGLGCAHGL